LPLARGQVATPTREEFIGNHPGNSDGMSTPSRVREGNSSHKTAQNRTPITGKPRSSWISWTWTCAIRLVRCARARRNLCEPRCEPRTRKRWSRP